MIVSAICAAVIFGKYSDKLLKKILNETRDDGAFESTEEPFSDFDEIWDAVQEWYGKEPRNGELVWKPGVSKFDTTVPKSVDGKFRFVAVITPSKDLEKNLFFCVETKTKSLLTWDEKGSVNRKDMFNSVELVKDIRRRNNISAEDLKNKIMGHRIAGLGGQNGLNFLGVNTGSTFYPSNNQNPDHGQGDEE